ncbi:Cyclin [Parasponia andersonii]|uniref:B-like cyclin n=1 Tax=Parasponia andersonii TaxID=3476 RepID=A0A2P5APG1_PARAD|nr:Cyclin [Parasponia andersonii]
MWLNLPDYDPYNPFSLSEDQGLETYLGVESLFMATEIREEILKYVRRRAQLVIFKYSKCENFEPIIPYLAMNYFDRVITHVTSPRYLDLLALCCLTLAWKMRNQNFTIPKLQAIQPDLHAITRKQFHTMELHIFKKLEWEMRAVTPFSFLRYFEPMLDPICSINRITTNKILIHAQSDLFFTSYKPSVVAAVALLATSLCLCPTRYSSFYKELRSNKIITKKQVVTFIPSMVIMCKELKLSPESGLLENKLLLISEQAAAGNSGNFMINPMLKNLNKLLIKYLSKPALEFGQVATEGEQSEASTSSQRPTAVKGKEKALETTTEIRNEGEDELVPDQVQGDPVLAQAIRELIDKVRLLNQLPPDEQKLLYESCPDDAQWMNQWALDQLRTIHEPAQVVPAEGQGENEPTE